MTDMAASGAETGATAARAARPRAAVAKGRTVLADLARPARRWTRSAVAAAVVEALAAVAFAFGVAHMIAAIAGGDGLDEVGAGFFLAALGALTRGGAAWSRVRAGFEASAEVRRAARAKVAAAIAGAGPAFVERCEAGALVSALHDDVEALDGWAARYLPQSIATMIAPLVIAGAVATQSWVVASLLILAAPMAPIAMALVGLQAAGAARGQMEELARLSGRFLDRLTGLPMLNALNAVGRETAGLAYAADSLRRRTMKVLRLAFLSSAMLELIAGVAIALCAAYVGLSLLGALPFTPPESVDLRAGIVAILLAPEFFTPLRQLSAAYHDRQSAQAAGERIAQLLEAAPVARAARPVDIPRAPEVVFDRAEVIYPDGRVGLADLTFTAPGGRITALVGESGAGKSTALKALLGFQRPTSGRITVGGVDWGQAQGFAAAAGWIGQTPRLFHGTIADNIRLGKPEATDAEVEAAAAAAGVSGFAAELPQGLDTRLGERGFGLSGGQAQRVALARALLKDAPLLLLDEPTASLDAETEAAFFEALKRVAQGRTVIIATHSRAGANLAAVTIDLSRTKRAAAA